MNLPTLVPGVNILAGHELGGPLGVLGRDEEAEEHGGVGNAEGDEGIETVRSRVSSGCCGGSKSGIDCVMC